MKATGRVNLPKRSGTPPTSSRRSRLPSKRISGLAARSSRATGFVAARAGSNRTPPRSACCAAGQRGRGGARRVGALSNNSQPWRRYLPCRYCGDGIPSIGGYLAGRLRSKRVGVHTHEDYFRDMAHSAAVLACAASIIVGGTAAGFTQAAGSAAGQSAGPVAGFVDSLLRADPAATPRRSRRGACTFCCAKLQAIERQRIRLSAKILKTKVWNERLNRAYRNLPQRLMLANSTP
jgi:hypothetical protein